MTPAEVEKFTPRLMRPPKPKTPRPPKKQKRRVVTPEMISALLEQRAPDHWTRKIPLPDQETWARIALTRK